MTHEEYVKSLKGMDFIYAIMQIAQFPDKEYVNWEQWLKAPMASPTLETVVLPYSGMPGRVHTADGNIINCLVLDDRTKYGQKVAVLITQLGQRMEVPEEQVEICLNSNQ